MIVHGRLLVDPGSKPPLGWIRTEHDRIVEVAEGSPPGPPDAGGPDAIISPGFIDAHIHLPQLESIGCEHGDLFQWLEAVIFPAEAAWASPERAAAGVRSALHAMAEAGTLGFAGYLTSHPHGLEAVEQEHAGCPLRAIVGQSVVDRFVDDDLVQPFAPLPAPSHRLAYSINPRFAVACSRDLLGEAGRCAADDRDVVIQTHLAEQVNECELVGSLFPECANYAAVYDVHGLLGSRTLLAHAVHMTPQAWQLVAERDSVVVHCPGANTFLRSGLFDLAAAREHGVRVALGSDVAAGPDIAMPQVARAMIEVAKLRALTMDPDAPVPSPEEAFRMITSGNADALGFEDGGRIEVGAAADVLVLRVPFPIDASLIGRLLYTWRNDYITDRIVGGAIHNVP